MNEQRNLQGRAAIVTGSARNIGRAIARALADAGAAVVVNAKSSAADADAVVREIREAGGQAIAKIADVGQPEAAASLVDAAIKAFGRLDILVNNAAVRREIDFEKLDYQEWRTITATILDGAYLCAHAASPHLIAAGGGSIVNIGGLSSYTGAARRAHVIAAKAGLVGLTRALAHDLAPHGITVNCVAPGLIDTERRGPNRPTTRSMPRSSAGAARQRKSRPSCGSCADPRRATSRARRCTPTAGCLWGKSRTPIKPNPKDTMSILDFGFGVWDLGFTAAAAHIPAAARRQADDERSSPIVGESCTAPRRTRDGGSAGAADRNPCSP